MAASFDYPEWLMEVKKSIGESKEWAVFLRELNDAVQQQLTESHVQYFSDLSDPEKELFMERASTAIEGGSIYNNLYQRVTQIIDKGMNDDVAKNLMDDSPLENKADMIVEHAESGALALLKKYNDMKSKLTICLNQGLPAAIRQYSWKLFLLQSKVRKQYVEQLNANPRGAISMYDFDISQVIENMINTEETLYELKGHAGSFYGLKAVLSYYHARLKTRERLRLSDHQLGIPFFLVKMNNLSRRDPPPGRLVADVVEEFITFMESRPGFIMDSGSAIHNEEFAGFIDKISKQLQVKNPDASRVVIETFTTDKDKTGTTETGDFNSLMDGMKAMLREAIRSMFVTYLRTDTLLYVWDQYMIGIDTPGFSTEWMSIICVTTIGLLKEKIRESGSPEKAVEVVKNETKKLSPGQYQFEVKQHYYKDLYSLLQHDEKAAMPVLDPTQALNPPWRHWVNDVVPPETKPKDRKLAREEREAEKERILQLKRDAELLKKSKEAYEKSEKYRLFLKHEYHPKDIEEEDEFLRAAAEERDRVEEEKSKIEEQIENERRKRLEIEKRTKDEIERLKRQMVVLQKAEIEADKRARDRKSPSIKSERDSLYSRLLIAPPPSAASMRPSPVMPPIQDLRTPTPRESPTVARNKVLVDFLRRVTHGLEMISQGEGLEKEELDRDTDVYLQQNIADIKRAQKEVFGHMLQPGEFEDMDPETQQKSSEKMLKLMQKWREERAKDELKRKIQR